MLCYWYIVFAYKRYSEGLQVDTGTPIAFCASICLFIHTDIVQFTVIPSQANAFASGLCNPHPSSFTSRAHLLRRSVLIRPLVQDLLCPAPTVRHTVLLLPPRLLLFVLMMLVLRLLTRSGGPGIVRRPSIVLCRVRGRLLLTKGPW